MGRKRIACQEISSRGSFPCLTNSFAVGVEKRRQGGKPAAPAMLHPLEERGSTPPGRATDLAASQDHHEPTVAGHCTIRDTIHETAH